MNIPNKNELTRIYGEAEKSAARFQAVADHFAEIYHHDIAEFFTAPGRTEIIGNHTDHNGGRVIAGSIDMDTIGAAYPNNSSVIRITSEGYDKEVVVDINDLASVPKAQGTVSLVAGMVEAIQKFGFKVAGFEEDAKKLHFTGRQASAILEMRLYKLIGLEILALEKEHRETLKKIAEYKKILGSRAVMNQVIKDDLAAIKAEFAIPRRTRIEDGAEAVYVENEISVQEVVFVMDRFGYCKLLDKSTYERNQETVDTEQVHVLRCLNTDKICLFSSAGVLHQIKALDIPSGKLRDKGVPIENLSKYDGRNETICLLTTARELKGRILLFATRLAMVKHA